MSNPRICIARHPSTGQAIHLKEGESGFWPIYGDLPDEEIEAFNSRHGNSPAQVEAMLAGSMFGWDVPAARKA